MPTQNATLVPELYVPMAEISKLRNDANSLTRWDLTARQICDLELLMNGAFNPLKGFLGREDYNNVLDHLRLKDGTLWPIPITLDVSELFAETIKIGDSIALCDQEGVILAKMEISDKWEPDKSYEAKKVFGTVDDFHPGVDYLINNSGNIYLGGAIKGIESPNHYDFRDRRNTPNELRSHFAKIG